VSLAEFQNAAFRGDNSGAVCPECSGLGTATPQTIEHGNPLSELAFTQAARNGNTILTPTGHYGPACESCGGHGKVYSEDAVRLGQKRAEAGRRYNETKDQADNISHVRLRQKESKVHHALNGE
jgi:hypothetical protein